jgi:hypothetical protein
MPPTQFRVDGMPLPGLRALKRSNVPRFRLSRRGLLRQCVGDHVVAAIRRLTRAAR